MRKLFLRIFWTILILSVLFVSAVWAWTYHYKSVALAKIEDAMKQYSKGEMRYKWASFGFLKKWGEITLSLYQVQMNLPTSKDRKSEESFAQIGQIHFSLDWGSVWEGNYQVKRIYAEEADITWGFLNLWQFPSDKRQLTCLQLERIQILGAQLRIPIQGRQDYGLIDFEKIAINFKEINDLQHFTLQASIDKCQYLAEKQIYWEIQKGNLQTELAYSPQSKMWQINETTLKVREANFAIRGNYTFGGESPDKVNLRFRGKEENLQALWAFLPTHYYEEFGGYKAKGKINFQGSLQGEVGKGKNPALEVDFGGQNIEIISPHSLQQSITSFGFVGKLNSQVLRITELEGKLGTQKFKGALTWANWAKPHLVADLEAGFDLSVLHEFYPLPRWENLKGLAGIKIHLDTDFAELAKTTTEPKKIIALGEVELINVTAKQQESQALYSKVNAKIILQNDLADIRNFAITWGANDLQAKGKMQNSLAYMLYPEQPLIFRGDITAKYLHIDEFAKPHLALPATLQAEARIAIDSLSFRKLQAKNVKADLSIKDKILKSGNLNLQVAEGTLSFLGILNAQKENFITLDGRIILKNTQANQILYAFGNLGQKIILDKQLTGRVDADIRSGLVFDKNLTLKLNHAVCDAELKLTNGEISEAPLLRDLAQKVQLPEVKQMAYKEIHALLQLRNQTLFVPELEIVGNHNIGIIGRATSEKGLDFKIRLQPKRNLVYHVNWTGNSDSFVLAFPPETEQPNLEANWQREKLTYLKIFKRQNTHENIKIDTMKIGI